MNMLDLGDVRLHVREDGDPDGAPVVFANSLGTDLRLWDKVLPLLPKGLRFIRYDKRGHGLSSCPDAPYSMGSLIKDAEGVMDHFGVKDALFVGLSIGGMIAQGLAVKRMDLIRSMVLSNTGAKIGTSDKGCRNRRDRMSCRRRYDALVFGQFPRHGRARSLAQYARPATRCWLCRVFRCDFRH